MQYFIAMIDYGRRGREAVVDLEVTRTEMIARIRSGELKNILFIHHVTHDDECGYGNSVDVTDELMSEAGAEDKVIVERAFDRAKVENFFDDLARECFRRPQ
jgi:hypothetical protein